MKAQGLIVTTGLGTMALSHNCWLAFLILLSGCARTVITPTAPNRPSPLAQRILPSLTVQYSSNITPGARIGTQYAFLILPLGRVECSEPEAFLGAAIAEQGVSHGVIAIRGEGAPLVFRLQELSLTVWDLLATRRVVISVRLQKEHYGRLASQTERCSSYQPYPFAEVLQHEVQKCVHTALKHLWP